MPKFLWKHIIDSLTIDHFIKMTITDREFMTVTTYDSIKCCVMANIKGNIIIVKCKADRINIFWIYTWHHHICYDSISDALNAVGSDKTKLIYYKILIKPKHYTFDVACYWFLNKQCNIEMSGLCDGHSNIPIITGTIQRRKYFYISQCFSMNNIVFKNIDIHFNTSVYESHINIFNCTFSNGSNLEIDCIVTAKISQCRFDKSDLNLGMNGCYINNNKPDDNDLIKMNYDIISNVFININTGCIAFCGDYHRSSIFNISSNTVLDCKLLCKIYMEYVSIYFTDNVFTNMISCIESYSNYAFVVFENNTFTNVKSLCIDNAVDIVKMSSNNTFTNCDNELIRYIEQSNNT